MQRESYVADTRSRSSSTLGSTALTKLFLIGLSAVDLFYERSYRLYIVTAYGNILSLSSVLVDFEILSLITLHPMLSGVVHGAINCN
jgi:hypothetical protein